MRTLVMTVALACSLSACTTMNSQDSHKHKPVATIEKAPKHSVESKFSYFLLDLMLTLAVETTMHALFGDICVAEPSTSVTPRPQHSNTTDR